MAAFTSCACAVATWFVTYVAFVGAAMVASTESSSPWALTLTRSFVRPDCIAPGSLDS
jgi:hypothetical protein